VGDIHGRLDLLNQLLDKIEADIRSREPSQNIVVVLGDLIDRGPDSAGVVERLRTWEPPAGRAIFLCGNHEEALLRILAGERNILADWLRFGGAECLTSYGLSPTLIRRQGKGEAVAAIRAAIPGEHQAFLNAFADTFRFGDYLFVHAGIRPGIGLSAQAKPIFAGFAKASSRTRPSTALWLFMAIPSPNRSRSVPTGWASILAPIARVA
jgi:serine/threonine protein phosphatase 1